MTWQEAYRAQALDDLQMFDFLLAPAAWSIHRCHQLYYLQKAGEKWVKASGTGKPPFQHGILAYYVSTSNVEKPDILRLAEKLDALEVRGSNQANTEYPWETAPNSGNVIAPVNFDYDALVSPQEAIVLADFLAKQLCYRPKNF